MAKARRGRRGVCRVIRIKGHSRKTSSGKTIRVKGRYACICNGKFVPNSYCKRRR